MEIKGKIKVINTTQQVTDTFTKRELVVTTEEQYPQDILIEFVQDKTSILDSYNVGDSVTVGINIRGREWTSPKGDVKYFNSIHGWRVNKGEGVQSKAPTSNIPVTIGGNEDDDLPF